MNSVSCCCVSCGASPNDSWILMSSKRETSGEADAKLFYSENSFFSWSFMDIYVSSEVPFASFSSADGRFAALRSRNARRSSEIMDLWYFILWWRLSNSWMKSLIARLHLRMPAFVEFFGQWIWVAAFRIWHFAKVTLFIKSNQRGLTPTSIIAITNLDVKIFNWTWNRKFVRRSSCSIPNYFPNTNEKYF